MEDCVTGVSALCSSCPCVLILFKGEQRIEGLGTKTGKTQKRCNPAFIEAESILLGSVASLKLEGHQVVSELVLGYGCQTVVSFDLLFHILLPHPRQKTHNKRWYCLARIVRKIHCCLKKMAFTSHMVLVGGSFV